MKFTSKNLLKLGVVDDVIEEPLGGAHRDHHKIANMLKLYLMKTVRELMALPVDQLLDNRYERFRRIGVFLEEAEEQGGEEETEPQAVEVVS